MLQHRVNMFSYILKINNEYNNQSAPQPLSSGIRPTDYEAWKECEPQVRVVKLRFKELIVKWNAIVQKMLIVDCAINPQLTKSLSNARIDDAYTNPEVAYLTRGSFTLTDLSKMQPSELNAALVAFVTYSVFQNSQWQLIFPRVLHKLPNGFGNFGMVKDGKPVAGVIKNVTRKLKTNISKKYPKHIILCRFPCGATFDNAWSNKLILHGLKQYEERHFRLGWLSYKQVHHLVATPKKKSNPGPIAYRKIVDIGASPESNPADRLEPQLIQSSSCVFGPTGAKPEAYQPGKGGATIDENNLTVTNAEGKTLFKMPIKTLGNPLARILSPNFQDYNLGGNLMCGWT